MSSGDSPDMELHAHLLAMEAGGRVVRETPVEVINEVEFRATYVSSLLEEMFRETQKRNRLEVDGTWD